MMDKPFEKQIGGMDERKACKVNTIAFLHPSICNCVRASSCQVDQVNYILVQRRFTKLHVVAMAKLFLFF